MDNEVLMSPRFRKAKEFGELFVSHPETNLTFK